MAEKANRESVVKQGGVAGEPSNAEDVTRDTYGYAPASVSEQKDERVGEADRAAATVGIPGVAMPPPDPASEALAPEEEEQDESVRRTDVSGDRVASRRDVEKLRSKRS
jgi:hypothetical protein